MQRVPAIPILNNQPGRGRRPSLVDSAGRPSYRYNLINDYMHNEGNDPTRNPFISGIVPLRPVFDMTNTSERYTSLRDRILILEQRVRSIYRSEYGVISGHLMTTRTMTPSELERNNIELRLLIEARNRAMGTKYVIINEPVRPSPIATTPNVLVATGRTGGGYGPVPTEEYYREVERINNFLRERNIALADLTRLNVELARVVEEANVDVMNLDFDQIVHFISWRLSDGDAMINVGGVLDFPYQRGPQEVRVKYKQLYLTDEEKLNIDNLDLSIPRMTIESRMTSVRGVDFFGQSLNAGLARGCVKHFYSNIVEALARRCRELRFQIGPVRTGDRVGLTDMLRVPRDVWAQVIFTVYQLDNMDMAYALGDRMRVFFDMLATNRLVTVEQYTGALTAIYTSTRMYGITMTPLYKRKGLDMAAVGLGFLAKYKYTGNDPAIIQAQNDSISGKHKAKKVDRFSERIRNPRLIFQCVVNTRLYDTDQGSGVIFVDNNNNSLKVKTGYRLPIRVGGVTVGQNGMAVGQLTAQLEKDVLIGGVIKQRCKRYFGNNQYHIEYTPEQQQVWVDNSNSANLCAITSLIYNDTLRPIIEKEIRIEEFIGQVTLASNMYVDDRLIRCDRERVTKVHRLILDWIAKRVTGDIDNIYVRYYKGKNCKIYQYRVSDGCYAFTPAELMITNRAMIISVFMHEDHIFNVTDGSLERHSLHLLHLRLWFTRHAIEPRPTTIRCFFNELLMEIYTTELLTEKHRILEMRDFWYRKMNVRSVFLPSAMIRAAGNELLESFEAEEDEETSTEKQEELFALIGRSLEAKELLSLFYQCVNNPCYGYFDFETNTDLAGKVRVYGYGLETDSIPLMSREILSVPGGVTVKNESLLILDLLAQVAIPIRAQAIFEREQRAMARGVDAKTLPIYYSNVKLFAHNGGRFDFVLFRNLICGDSLEVCSELQKHMAHMHGFKFAPENDIITGGKIKFMIVKVLDSNSDELFKICFVDSLNLLECPLSEVSKEYNLAAHLYDKGGYPYRFYDYVINNKLKLEWYREELINNNFPLGVRRDINKYLSTTDKEVINLVELFHDYCKQDVRILKAGIDSAHRMYHQIDVTNIRDAEGKITGQIKPGAVLSDEHGIVWSVNSDGKEKRKKIRFKDSVTLPGFAKAIARFSVLGDNVMTTNSVMHEYTSVYTGGVTYNKEVTKFYSSIIDRIALNPYFYVPETKPDLVELMVRHGYDVNKPKRTYKLSAVPPEVLQLREDLKNCDDAGIYLVDSNSLYPHAISKVEQVGGFPIGKDSVIRDVNHFNELLTRNKRCVVYFRVRFTVKGLVRYREKRLKPMHQLLIRTEKGNRHLRPTDAECRSYGMTDIMYRSVMGTDTGLFTLEFINGIYWEETSNKFSDLMKILYAERKRWKARKSPIEKRVKLVMNSMYGFLLEQCHYIVSEYLDTREDFKLAKKVLEYNEETGVSEEIEAEPASIIPSKFQTHKEKYESISNYENMIGYYIRSEHIDIAALDEYASLSYYGSCVLDMSKHEMNILFSKLNWDILYTDTDSAFITNQQYFGLLAEDEGQEVKFMGPELGQYKSDFDDKWKGAKRVAYDGIISIASVFLAKKLYCNVLLGATTDKLSIIPNPEFPDDRDKDIDDSDYYVSINTKTAGKGAVHAALSFTQYEALADPMNVIVQDRAGLLAQVFVLLGGAKSGKGIHITDKEDPKRQNISRTIKNQDAIEADTLRGRGVPKIERNKIYQGFTMDENTKRPIVVVRKPITHLTLQLPVEPRQLTLNIM